MQIWHCIIRFKPRTHGAEAKWRIEPNYCKVCCQKNACLVEFMPSCRVGESASYPADTLRVRPLKEQWRNKNKNKKNKKIKKTQKLYTTALTHQKIQRVEPFGSVRWKIALPAAEYTAFTCGPAAAAAAAADFLLHWVTTLVGRAMWMNPVPIRRNRTVWTKLNDTRHR